MHGFWPKILRKVGYSWAFRGLVSPSKWSFRIEHTLSIETLASLVALETEHNWKDVLMGKGLPEERVKWKHRM